MARDGRQPNDQDRRSGFRASRSELCEFTQHFHATLMPVCAADFCPLVKEATKLSRDVLGDQRTSLDQVSARECSIGRCGLMRIRLVSLRKSPHRFPLAAFGDSAVHQAGEV